MANIRIVFDSSSFVGQFRRPITFMPKFLSQLGQQRQLLFTLKINACQGTPLVPHLSPFKVCYIGYRSLEMNRRGQATRLKARIGSDTCARHAVHQRHQKRGKEAQYCVIAKIEGKSDPLAYKLPGLCHNSSTTSARLRSCLTGLQYINHPGSASLLIYYHR
jgi:hypothetical protein